MVRITIYHALFIKRRNMAYNPINTLQFFKINENGVRLRFFAPLGIILRSSQNEYQNNYRNDIKILNNPKVKEALEVVYNPFTSILSIASDESIFDNHSSWLLKLYAKVLVFAYNYFYFLLYLLSYLRMDLFENSAEAIRYFCSLYPGTQQSKLCLPRSIFAATTSKSFKKNGCMFIGVFYPSTNLHAWIVEDRRVAYQHDYYWIHFTPIVVMT